MSFTIIDVYRDNVPRGVVYPGSAIVWDTGGNDDVSVVPGSGEAIRISKLLIVDGSFTPVLEAATPKLAQLTYPNEDGSAEITINFDSMDELKQLVTEAITIDSTDYLVIEFKAPIWLMDSRNNKTFKMAFKGTSVTSGTLLFRPMGWKINEILYE